MLEEVSRMGVLPLLKGSWYDIQQDSSLNITYLSSFSFILRVCVCVCDLRGVIPDVVLFLCLVYVLQDGLELLSCRPEC